MTKKVLRRIAAVILTAVIVAGTMLTAFAETSQYVPYESYTYWQDISGEGSKLVYNRPMYETEGVFGASDLGVENFVELIDVCTDPEGNVYLLDAGSGNTAARVVKLDANYKFVNEIASVKKANGEQLVFTGAQDIYAHKDGSLYISDTENKRVIKCDSTGNFIDEYTLPDSPLIPSDFNYRPIKCVADSRGYVYILSEGSYYGALLFAPAESGTAKEFIGFYGANTVVNNILGAIQSVFNRMFPNNEKMKNSKRVLPSAFSDIVIDDADFIYTVTDGVLAGQVKKLNPGAGNNIIESDEVNFADFEVSYTYNDDGSAYSHRLSGLAIDEEEFMYVLDTNYGRVLVYDADCRMITCFGGGVMTGTKVGTFETASAIALKNIKDKQTNENTTQVLVADKMNNTLTVFNCNDYGNLVMKLTRMTIEGDYVESREGWEEVMSLDRNLQVAYTGLARAYLAENMYEEAMQMALEGYDRETYALAYEYYRQQIVDKYFTLAFIIVLLVAAAIIVGVVLYKKKHKNTEEVVAKDTEFKLALRTALHPGLAFEEIKDKGRGSVLIAFAILVVFYITAVLQTLWGGFLFTNFDPGSFNSLWVLVQSMGVVVLWVIANWLVTTLAGGKGKMKEIFIVTCYSLTPIICQRVLFIILSNFLLPAEGTFLTILSTAAMIYTGLILIIGMLRIHDFTMTRFLGTTLLTVLGMAAIVFLMILIGILLQQLGGFVSTVVIELLM